MPSWYDYGWEPRVVATPAELRARLGRAPAPVVAVARRREIAQTFWGRAWCAHLEAYGDMSNRLPRGRTYLRNGSVRDLHIERGRITGLVQGTQLYEVVITIEPMTGAQTEELAARVGGELASVIELLEGRLSRAVMTAVTHRATGLFPARKEIAFDCSCPDGAYVCKHVAAIFYGISLRLDQRPELFFELRGLSPEQLVRGAALGQAAISSERRLGGDLSAIFGVHIEDALPDVRAAARVATKKPTASKAQARATSTGREVAVRKGPKKKPKKPRSKASPRTR